MSSDYNSKLISELYSLDENETDAAEEILLEMEEIKDPVFIYPIYDTYKKFTNTPITHYFLHTLNSFESKDVLEFAIKIVLDKNTPGQILAWALPILTKQEYFDNNAVEKAKKTLEDFYNSNNYLPLDYLVEYIDKASRKTGKDDIKRTLMLYLGLIFEDDRFTQGFRTKALDYLLKIDPKKILQEYINNYHKIQGKKAEIILSRIIRSWTGPLSSALQTIIIERGTNRAKELIEEQRKREIKNLEAKKEKELEHYENTKIVYEIIEFRKRINIVTYSEEDIGFELFPDSELLIKQSETAKDEISLRGRCSELRSIVQKFHENIAEHGYTPEEAKTLLPELPETDFKKSLNKLYLYLNAKKIPVGTDIFGLRTVNKISTLLGAHPEEKKDTIKELKGTDLMELYKLEDWRKIHQKILEEYKSALEKLHNALMEIYKKP